MYWIKQFPYLHILLINLSLSAELSAEFSGVTSWNPQRSLINQPYQFSQKEISIVSVRKSKKKMTLFH